MCQCFFYFLLVILCASLNAHTGRVFSMFQSIHINKYNRKVSHCGASLRRHSAWLGRISLFWLLLRRVSVFRVALSRLKTSTVSIKGCTTHLSLPVALTSLPRPVMLCDRLTFVLFCCEIFKILVFRQFFEFEFYFTWGLHRLNGYPTKPTRRKYRRDVAVLPERRKLHPPPSAGTAPCPNSTKPWFCPAPAGVGA